MKNLKIIFELDGTGIYYDINEPLHLDALLAWALTPFYCKDSLTRDEVPFDIPLPIDKWKIGPYWGWRASALLPEFIFSEGIQFWRKKMRQDRIHLTTGSPNLQMGCYREYNNPMTLLLCKKMIAYTVGKRSRVLSILRKHVKYLGKKTAYGKGRIISIDAEYIQNDYSLVMEGCTMRWLPKEGGTRKVRIRPPYWNNIDKVECCEIGEVVEQTNTLYKGSFW